ncbi:hypothetical protein QAD02_005126 [Eretmocerus hayati]|uniref:Uncharacterized protein n=1 Tax=Eretmocerus hayati TaxID=131215 RepID=A0ACC2NU78_9HYME|nr:hypothetical protein QAD02_005126 [Eretmocerus hayati]
MKVFQLCIVTIVLGWVASENLQGNTTLQISHSNSRVRRLAGGLHTSISAHPYIASILNGRKHVCGGTLISKNLVLTAAHCVFYRWYKKLSVIIGSAHANSGGNSYKVSKVSYHKNFIYSRMTNDAALLKIGGSIASTKNVGLVTLINKFEKSKENIDAESLGWDRDGNLKKIDLKTISLDECARRMRETIETLQGHICTTTIDEGPSTGDSGGPLLIGRRQAGILSTMVDRTENNIVGEHTNSYTNIADIKDWIDEETFRLNRPNQPSVIYHPLNKLDLESNRKLQEKPINWNKAAFVVKILAPTSDQLLCTGTIVGPAHVLTSAECAKTSKLGYQVISNSNSLTKMDEERTVIESHPHESYRINSHGIPENNVGLLIVSPSFLGNQEVRLSAKKLYAREETTVYGWSPYKKDTIHSIQGEITDDGECNEIYSKIFDVGGLPKGQLCMSTRHGNCLVDKGGPLIVEDHQIGIASWHHPECADFRYPTIYTKITPLQLSWIKNMISETFTLAKNEVL